MNRTSPLVSPLPSVTVPLPNWKAPASLTIHWQPGKLPQETVSFGLPLRLVRSTTLIPLWVAVKVVLPPLTDVTEVLVAVMPANVLLALCASDTAWLIRASSVIVLPVTPPLPTMVTVDAT